MSHTVSVAVECRDHEALAAAAVAMGGQVIGAGEHQLYAGRETGYAVQLPGWRYPIVATAGGGLRMDNYGGAWGDAADLDRLRERYALEAAALAAERLGWMVERQPDRVVIYHPDGGTLTVEADGSVAAAGFVGGGCVDAAAPIEEALGRPVERVLAPEYLAERARVGAREG